MGRCVEQPRADLRPLRAGVQPALGLGRREARPAAGRREVLVRAGAVRPRRPNGRLLAVFLGHLVVQPDEAGGEGADRVPVAARAGREDDDDEQRLRHPAGPLDVRLQDLGDGRSANRLRLQLSGEAASEPDNVGRLRPGAGRVRRAGLHQRPEHQADRAHRPGRRDDRPGDGLGRARADHDPSRRKSARPRACPSACRWGSSPMRSTGSAR